MPSSYITNPLTGRPIRVGGNVFNRLIVESFDFIDGRLTLRQGVSLPQDPPQYLNVYSGRMVRYGTSTYFRLIRDEYDVIDGHYLIRNDDGDLIDALHEEFRRDRVLTFNEINALRAELEELFRAESARFIHDGLARIDASARTFHPSTLEDHAPRLAAINVALCQECLMPESPDDLQDGCCIDCTLSSYPSQSV